MEEKGLVDLWSLSLPQVLDTVFSSKKGPLYKLEHNRCHKSYFQKIITLEVISIALLDHYALQVEIK